MTSPRSLASTRSRSAAPRVRVLRAFALCALLVLPSLAGCHCGAPKTDEQRLKERIDTTSVHLYVALKIALSKSGASPEVMATRAKLLALISASAALYVHATGAGATPTPTPTPTTVPPTPTPTSVPPTPAPPTRDDAASALRTAADLTRDVATIAVALYQLRAEGAAIVRGEREDELPPVLPGLFAAGDASPELIARLDANGEHAVLLFAFFVLKTHPKSPVPIPDELVLYEASRTDAATLRFVGLRPIARAVKAWIFGNASLCDLAAGEAAGIPASGDAAWRAALRDDLRVLGAPDAPDDAELTKVHAAARGLAHGEAAVCYLDRDEPAKADAELEALADAAEEAGLPREDVAPIRAYLAWRHDDLPAAKRHLLLARTSPRLDARDRAAIDELLTYLDARDPRFGAHFDRVYFTVFAARIFLDALERAHLVDQLSGTPLYRQTRAFVTSAGRVLGASQQALPTADALEKGAGTLFERLHHKKTERRPR